ncbi:MAG: biotin/lipoyl-binding protein, partial [Lachnospiraceae bacterium]|nr:biotin/lipoyl-binding protein [Lachnospiraceae bacterium]
MNKKKTVKKIIIIILIFAVVIAGVIFALSMLKKKNQNKREVLVVPVSSMSSNPNEWGMGDTSYSGYVSASMNQKVYINASTKIEEVYVSEGQTVKAGDTILKYDVTAQQLQLESKKAQVALANNRVTSLERDLKRLNETVPIEDMPKPEPVVPPAAPEDNLATDTDASSEQPVQEPEQQPSDTSGVDDTDMGMTY